MWNSWVRLWMICDRQGSQPGCKLNGSTYRVRRNHKTRVSTTIVHVVNESWIVNRESWIVIRNSSLSTIRTRRSLAHQVIRDLYTKSRDPRTSVPRSAIHESWYGASKDKTQVTSVCILLLIFGFNKQETQITNRLLPLKQSRITNTPTPAHTGTKQRTNIVCLLSRSYTGTKKKKCR